MPSDEGSILALLNENPSLLTKNPRPGLCSCRDNKSELCTPLTLLKASIKRLLFEELLERCKENE